MEGVYGISSRGLVNYRDRVGLGTAQPLSVFNMNKDNIGAFTTAFDDSMNHVLSNQTPAIAVTQQCSPAMVWQGNGWKTNAAAGSQDVRFRAFVLPVSGAANPTAQWVLQRSFNGGTYLTMFTINSDVSTGGVGLTFSSGRMFMAADSAGLYTFMSNYSNAGAGSYLFTFRNDASQTYTSGTGGVITITQNFVASSGNAVVNYFNLAPTINQTGTATGIVRGLYINPTLTSVTGEWRAIDVVLGKSVFQGVGVGNADPSTTSFLKIGAGTTTIVPLLFTSGTNLTTAVAGGMEYNGTNLFFTRSGTTREGILTQSAVTTEVVVSDTTVTININGTTYKLLAKA